jgi:RimJ/RimL family protein N-acetyltransferase
LTAVHLEPWEPNDLRLLVSLVGDPVMMAHLGGPEPPEKIAARHQHYLQLGPRGSGQMFKVVDDTGAALGSVGYWPRTWHGQEVYETGWTVLPAFQGRGVATAAMGQVIALARAERTRQLMHAFPSVDNLPSNAICRKLGFTLMGESDVEYPPGQIMRCNDWRLALT